MITIKLIKITTNYLLLAKYKLDRLKIRIGYWKFRFLLNSAISFLKEKSRKMELFSQYKNLIGHTHMVFDVGCNVGLYTDIFLKLANKVVAIDANSELLVPLTKRFKNQLNTGKLVVVNSAVTEKIGTTNFFKMSSVNLSSTSLKWKNNVVPKMFQHVKNVDCQNVPSITLDYLISKYGIPHYIKIDIEGGELNAIQGLNHCVQLLSVEVTLPYLHQEIISIVEKLSKLGNYNYRILQEGNYNFNQNYIEKSQLIKMIKEENINGVFELYCYLNISSDN